MAIYHINIKAFSRGKGESSVAAAAYRAGIDLMDTRTRVVHRFSRRTGVAGYHMLAPADAPDWARDPFVLWDTNEAGETRANARVARELEASLPHELSEAQREALALKLGQWLVDRYRCAVLVAIHKPTGKGDNRNHHVHLLMSSREVGPSGLEGRAGAVFEARSGGGAEEVKKVRELVAAIINEHLAQAGVQERVDHRTLKAQAMEAEAEGDAEKAQALRRPPTRHNGKVATAFARKTLADREKDAWDTAVAKAKAAGVYVETPEGHTHEAALADRLIASRPDPRDPEAFRSAWVGDDHWRSRSLSDLQPSPVARHLSRVGHVGRLGKRGTEVLDTVADLVQGWVASIKDQADAALERAKRYVPEPAEGFLDAVKALHVPRVGVYGTRPHFFHDTEFLLRLLIDYSKALVSPLIKAERFIRARDRASVAKTMCGTQSAQFLEASRELWKAKRATSESTRERDRRRIDAALRALDETRKHYEETYFVNFTQPVVNEPVETIGTVEEQGSSESNRLVFKPPMTSTSHRRPRMH